MRFQLFVYIAVLLLAVFAGMGMTRLALMAPAHPECWLLGAGAVGLLALIVLGALGVIVYCLERRTR